MIDPVWWGRGLPGHLRISASAPSECPWASCHFHLGTAWRSVIAASRESSLFHHLQRLLVTNCTVFPQPSLGWRWSSFSTGLLNSAMTFIHSLKQQTLRLTKSIPKRVFLVFPCGLFLRTSGQDYGTGTEEQTQFCPLNLQNAENKSSCREKPRALLAAPFDTAWLRLWIWLRPSAVH